MDRLNLLWIESSVETIAGYRRMIDAALNQLSDTEFFARPSSDVNSVAIVIRHLAGNLHSRWTDYLTTDGEKPDRDRDCEFEEWQDDRDSLMEYFNSGWACLESAIGGLNDDSVAMTIQIRGEDHSVPDAVMRSLTHVSYHVGQILIIARLVHHGKWNWLTVAPGASAEHNRNTWGTAASRTILAAPDEH